MTAAADTRDWKPVRRGAVYCAPACGRGCKRAWYDKAVKRAKAEVAKLGPGWTYEVWENLGWHFHLRSPCRRIVVSFQGDNSVLALFAPTPGDNAGRWAGHGATVEEAVQEVVGDARADLKTVQAMVDGVAEWRGVRVR